MLPFAQVPIALLRDRHLHATDKVIAGLIMPWLRKGTSGWVFNAILAEGAGIHERTVPKSLERLRGWFRCEVLRGDKKGRVITALWRLEGFKIPSTVPPDPARRGRGGVPERAGGGMPAGAPELESSNQNQEEDFLQSARYQSSRETTLSDDGSPATNDCPARVEELGRMLAEITGPEVTKKALRGRVTSCGKWLATQLVDLHSKANYCRVLYEVAKGDLTAGQVLEAFQDTYSAVFDGRAGEGGAYFFGAIGLMKTDLAHEEVEADLRRRKARPAGRPVEYND